MQVDAIEKALAIAARNKLTKEHKQKVLFCVWCLLISCVGAWHLLAPPFFRARALQEAHCFCVAHASGTRVAAPAWMRASAN
jgi:hypothetical protein